MLRAFAPLSLWFFTAFLPAQSTDSPPGTLTTAIAEQGIQHSQVMTFQDTLCHEYGSRLTGSLAFGRAAAWARDQFAAMGLDARLEPWGQWACGWDREQWMGRMVAPAELELQVATPAWTGSTRGIVRGTLVPMPQDAAAAAAIAVRLAGGESIWLWGGLPGDENTRTTVQGWLTDGKVPGLAQSAKSTGWNDDKYPAQIRVFGDMMQAQKPFAERPRWGRAIVRDDQAAVLEQHLQGKEPVVVEFELRNRWRQGPIEHVNVVADLRGIERPDEVVIVCAHLDSWHQATGATDNGTGVCTTLEAARILTAVGCKPRRTVRFILWGGEEQGLLGSRQYVVRHRQQMAKVSAVFNHDGGTNWAHALTVPESQAADFQPIVAAITALLKVPQAGHEGPSFTLGTTKVLQPAGGGSDHASFGAVGVPAFGWGQTGEVQYGRGWHSQWDTWSIVVPQYQAHTATVVAMVAHGVAQLDHLLSREGVERATQEGLISAATVLEVWLGVALEGLKVTAVEAGGLGARSGLQVGDVALGVGAETAQAATELLPQLRAAFSADAEVVLRVRRGEQEPRLTIVR
ncbi:MAG: M20/M25/M40 family metallo-hydrolase [Planctomycetes bacterium]|nr:M20/M25/M40 family metallo-hydrolase [Planctomycetota bacterium]